ncbi:MAG: hypothetical protein ABI614_01890 [Planctomycetota bacterium]
MARQRLGSTPLVALHRLVVKPLATPQTPGAFYRGLRKVAIDGTVLDVPDCDAHQHGGRSSGSRGEGPLPQVRKVSLVELGTHIEFAFVDGGWKDAEKKLVEQLWESIPEDALLIEDRGFFSYQHWKLLHEKHNGPSVVQGFLSDSQDTLARTRSQRRVKLPRVVRGGDLGNQSRANPGSSKPNQPARDQTENVPLEQMPPRT